VKDLEYPQYSTFLLKITSAMLFNILIAWIVLGNFRVVRAVSNVAYSFGDYTFEVSNSVDKSIPTHPTIVLRKIVGSTKYTVFKSVDTHPLLVLGNGSVPLPPILNGNYQLQETVATLSNSMTVDAIVPSKSSVEIKGELLFVGPKSEPIIVAVYSLKFCAAPFKSNQLQFSVDVKPITPSGDKKTADALFHNARSILTYHCEVDEDFYGFGESFSYFNLKGRNVPILVSEQGVGRGEEPITDYLNTNVAQGVGGTWYTTYAPKPVYITNFNRTLYLNNSEVSFVNLTHSGDLVGEISIVNICLVFSRLFPPILERILTTYTTHTYSTLPPVIKI
jgi:hypothetical protein